MFLDCYAVFHQGEKKFWFGTIQSDLSVDRDMVTKFKNPKVQKIKDLKSIMQAKEFLLTLETYVPMREAVETLGGFGLKPRALRKLKRNLNISDIWLDISTGDITH